MPVEDFLNDFIPLSCIPDYSSTAHHFWVCHSFNAVVDVVNELGMYTPFVSSDLVSVSLLLIVMQKINSISSFAPQLCFINSHARGDKKTGFKFEIKPDISVYHNMLGEAIPAGCDSSLLNMHIEFKWYKFENPFSCPPSDSNQDQITFIGPSDNQQDTLGQIGTYAAAQLISQFRTHCFSVFILYDTTHIIRWDREGAVVTEPILYNIDSSLVEFFSWYLQAPPELHGVSQSEWFGLDK